MTRAYCKTLIRQRQVQGGPTRESDASRSGDEVNDYEKEAIQEENAEGEKSGEFRNWDLDFRSPFLLLFLLDFTNHFSLPISL